MLTVRFRWLCVVEPACWFKGHRWEEYAVIHAAWNTPGKFCRRCRRAVTRSWPWVASDGKATAGEVVETTQPVFKVEVSR